MKKLFFIPAAILFLTYISTNIVAQQNSDTNLGASMAILPLGYVAEHRTGREITGEKIYLSKINIDCLVNFKNRFKGIENELWSKQPNGEYIASFTADSISFCVYYDKKGKWKSTLQGYKENKMPFEIRDMVKREYYDFTIDHVDEIETFHSNNAPTYLIYMHHNNQTKILRVCDREMDIWMEMTKE